MGEAIVYLLVVQTNFASMLETSVRINLINVSNKGLTFDHVKTQIKEFKIKTESRQAAALLLPPRSRRQQTWLWVPATAFQTFSFYVDLYMKTTRSQGRTVQVCVCVDMTPPRSLVNWSVKR